MAKKVSLSITFGDEVLKGKGETMLEAIESITPPVKIFLKGIVRATDGKKQVEKVWLPKRMRRMFMGISKKYVADELTYLMK